MIGPGGVPGLFVPASCPLCGSGERRVVVPAARDRLLEHPGTFAVCECLPCGARYLDPRPEGATLLGYYGANGGREYPDNQEKGRVKTIPPAARWLLHRERGYPKPDGAPPSPLALRLASRWLERDRDRWRYLDWHGGGRLLDVGCGSGSYLAMMRVLGWRVEGVNAVAEACEVVERSLGIPCHRGDLLDLGLSAGSFDAVTLWHVLEHLPRPRATLGEVRRLLRGQGLLGIGVPVYDCPEAERLGDAWLGYDVPRHLVTFSRARLRSFLEECGFRVVRIESEMRDRILKLSYARGDAPWPLRQIMRHGRLRRWYARRLSRQDRIGTVVAIATPR